MKFRVTLTYEYDVSDVDLVDVYGTTDAVEAARMDRDNLLEDPGSLDLLTDYAAPLRVVIDPVKE